jgi:hypothetical protein
MLSSVPKHDGMDIPGSRNGSMTFIIHQRLAMTEEACKRHTIEDSQHIARRRTMKHELPAYSTDLNLVAPFPVTNFHTPFLVHADLHLVGISPLHAAA